MKNKDNEWNGMCAFRASISSIFVVIHLSRGFAFVSASFYSYTYNNNDYYRDDNIDYLLIHFSYAFIYFCFVSNVIINHFNNVGKQFEKRKYLSSKQ